MSSKNANFHKAKEAKKDEFYTQLTDIEKELQHYKEHFKNKVVFCNCDDPEWSNFWHFFAARFNLFGLKKLIATHYDEENPSYMLSMEKQGRERPPVIKHLQGNGDFRSDECIELLKEADIVVTNPPFSLFREYVAQLIEYDKKFVIIGNQNAITYKEFFPLLKDNKVWIGYGANKTLEFTVPDYYEAKETDINGRKVVKVPAITWFTNLDIKKRHEDLILYKHYSPEEYPKYENYDAINVKKIAEIPCDYDGVMGVPITFLNDYNPEQFEIVGMAAGNSRATGFYFNVPYVPHKLDRGGCGVVNGKRQYARILIKRKERKNGY